MTRTDRTEHRHPRRARRLLAAGVFTAAIVSTIVSTLAPTPPAAGAELTRGDADNDGSLAITDAIFILNFLFLGGPAPLCDPIADVNADGVVNISDGVTLLGHLFLGGPPPPPLTAGERGECGESDPAAVARGEEVYRTPDPDGNLFACATCHTAVPPGETDLLLPGSTLWDALRRPSYKLGKVDGFIGAANTCRVHWMDTTPWSPGDREFTDLVAFLESISPEGPAPPVVYTIVEPASGELTGDPAAGCKLYRRSCIVCHGPDGTGTVRAPSIVEFPLSVEFIRAKVRLSGPIEGSPYEGLEGGFMPFFSAEVLDDAQLDDIAAFILVPPLPPCGD